MLCAQMLPSYNCRSSKPCPGEPEAKTLSAEKVWLIGTFGRTDLLETLPCILAAVWPCEQRCTSLSPTETEGLKADSYMFPVVNGPEKPFPVSLCPMSALNFSRLISFPEVPPHGNVQTETDTAGSFFSCKGQTSVEPGLGGKRGQPIVLFPARPESPS